MRTIIVVIFILFLGVSVSSASYGVSTDNATINNIIDNVYSGSIVSNWVAPGSVSGNPYGSVNSGPGCNVPNGCQLLWDNNFPAMAFAYTNDYRMYGSYYNWGYYIDNDPYASDPAHYGVWIQCNFGGGGGTGCSNINLNITAMPIITQGFKMYYYQTGNVTVLRHILPYLDLFAKWAINNRQPDGDNLYTVGSKGNGLQQASWEYLDYTTAFDTAIYNSSTSMIDYKLVGQSAAYAKIFEDIAEMYNVSSVLYSQVGDSTNATKESNNASNYTQRWQSTCSAINSVMLKSDGMYYDVQRGDNASLGHKYIGGLFPLFAGCPNQSQASTLVNNHILNTSEFWRTYGIPTIAESDSSFNTNDAHNWAGKNWRGDAWWSTNWIIADGLRRYGYYAEAKQLAEKSYSARSGYWSGCNGNMYDSDTGGRWDSVDFCPGDNSQALSSGIVPLLIENLYGINYNFSVVDITDFLGSGKWIITDPITINYTKNSGVTIKKKLSGNITIKIPGTWSDDSHIHLKNGDGNSVTWTHGSIVFANNASETYTLTYDSYVPSTPVGLTNSTGLYWVNYTWQPGTGNITDGYNINVNGVWTNGTTNNWILTSTTPSGWVNITIFAYNSTGTSPISSLAGVSQNTQVSSSLGDYKIPILINNTGNSNDLTDYQVLVNVTWNNHMNSNFSDLLIRNDTSSTLLSYWLDPNSTVNGSYANIWFNASFIPANMWTNNTYYLYYGVPSTTHDNHIGGNGTFMFFDDFSSGTAPDSRWTATGTWTINNGVLKNICSSANCVLQTSTFSITNGIIEAIIQPDGYVNNFQGGVGGRKTTGAGDTTTGYNYFEYYYNSAQHLIQKQGGATLVSDAVTWTNNQPHTLKFVINGTNIAGNDDTASSLSTTDSTYTSGSAFITSVWTGTSGNQFRNYRIRKYTSLEPTTTFGGEIVVNNIPLITNVVNGSVGDTWGIVNFTVNQSDALTHIKYGTDESLSSKTLNQSIGTDRSVNITGLNNGTKYYYSVFAYNSSNTSKWSNSFINNFTTSSNITILPTPSPPSPPHPAKVTFTTVCTSNANTYSTILRVFSLGLLIMVFGFVLLQVKGIQSGEKQINPYVFVTSVVVVIIAFGMLILGNYLVSAIMSFTGC